MPKSAKLDSTEVARAVQHAFEAALATVLQQQNRRPVKPPPPASEVKQVAKAAAGLTEPSRKRGFRGTPPPATFDLDALPETSLLTEYEAAAAARLSTSTLSTWRKRPDHPLKWVKIGGGRVRYRAGHVRQFIATGYRPQPGRPRKKDAAPPPRRASAKPRTVDVAAAPERSP